MISSKQANIIRLAVGAWVIVVMVLCHFASQLRDYSSNHVAGITDAADYATADTFDNYGIFPHDDYLQWKVMIGRSRTAGPTSTDIDWCAKHMTTPNMPIMHAFVAPVLEYSRDVTPADRAKILQATISCLQSSQRLDRKSACLMIIFSKNDRDPSLVNYLTPLESVSDQGIGDYARRAVTAVNNG